MPSSFLYAFLLRPNSPSSRSFPRRRRRALGQWSFNALLCACAGLAPRRRSRRVPHQDRIGGAETAAASGRHGARADGRSPSPASAEGSSSPWAAAIPKIPPERSCRHWRAWKLCSGWSSPWESTTASAEGWRCRRERVLTASGSSGELIGWLRSLLGPISAYPPLAPPLGKWLTWGCRRVARRRDPPATLRRGLGAQWRAGEAGPLC